MHTPRTWMELRVSVKSDRMSRSFFRSELVMEVRVRSSADCGPVRDRAASFSSSSLCSSTCARFACFPTSPMLSCPPHTVPQAVSVRSRPTGATQRDGPTHTTMPSSLQGKYRAGGRIHTPRRVAPPVGHHQLHPQGSSTCGLRVRRGGRVVGGKPPEEYETGADESSWRYAYELVSFRVPSEGFLR